MRSFPLIAGFFALCASAAAAEVRVDTPSGYPVPRFAGVKYAEAACRVGPSFEHPVAVTFRRKGLPVLIIAETVDHWRKVRDREGGECWMHKTTLRGPTHVVTLKETDLLARPRADAPPRARLAAGVIARLEGQSRGWLRISASGIAGWTPALAVWGDDPDAALHN